MSENPYQPPGQASVPGTSAPQGMKARNAGSLGCLMSLGTLVASVVFGASFRNDLFVLFPEALILAVVVFVLAYAFTWLLA